MGTTKLTRKEILRRDPIRDALNSTYEFFVVNRSVILIALAISVLGVGGYYGWGYYWTSAQTQTHTLLAEAMNTFHAQAEDEVSPSDRPQAELGVKFKTKKEKYERALEQFQGLANRYGSRSVGQIARYYMALCQHRLGKTDEAVKTLQELEQKVKERKHAFLVKMALAQLYESQGNYNKAIELYTQLLKDSEVNPKDSILMSLGRAYESLPNKAEAIKAYQRVINEFPNSLYRASADDRLVQLGAKQRGEVLSTFSLNPATGQIGR